MERDAPQPDEPEATPHYEGGNDDDILDLESEEVSLDEGGTTDENTDDPDLEGDPINLDKDIEPDDPELGDEDEPIKRPLSAPRREMLILDNPKRLTFLRRLARTALTHALYDVRSEADEREDPPRPSNRVGEWRAGRVAKQGNELLGSREKHAEVATARVRLETSRRIKVDDREEAAGRYARLNHALRVNSAPLQKEINKRMGQLEQDYKEQAEPIQAKIAERMEKLNQRYSEGLMNQKAYKQAVARVQKVLVPSWRKPRTNIKQVSRKLKLQTAQS